jgi:CHAT domain-containing protein/tetratricopeptide (TPR) repeat protein
MADVPTHSVRELRDAIARAKDGVTADPFGAGRVLAAVLTDPAAAGLAEAETGEVHAYLAVAYTTILKSGHPEVLDAALGHARAALPLLGMHTELFSWVLARTTLAGVLVERTPADRRKAAVEEAVKLVESSIRISNGRLPGLGMTLLVVSLADAYRNRLEGDLAANVERAIAYLQSMLDSLAPDDQPGLRRMLQLNLGAALVGRPAGVRAANVEAAIAAYQSALAGWDGADQPATWAQLQQNLAAAYLQRGGDDQVADAGLAIDACRQALRVFTRDQRPADWLWTAVNLTSAYVLRIQKDETKATRLDDAREAVKIADEALAVIDRDVDALQWASLNAAAGSARVAAGDDERAIASYRRALEVFRPELSPVECRVAATNLGRIHSRRREWAAAADAYLLAIDALEAAYGEAQARWSREAELVRASDLYRAAAAALARAKRPAKAAEVAEHGRARALVESLDRGRPDPRLSALDPELVARYQAAVTAVAALDRARSPDPGIASSARTELAGVEAEIRRQPGLGDFLRPPGLAAIAAVLAPGEALAYAITTVEGTVFLVVHQGPAAPDVTVVPAEDFTLLELSRFLTEAALDPAGQAITGSSYLASQLAGQGDLPAALDRGLPGLGRQLVAPLADELARLGTRSLVLVPTGLLSLLPLHAAPLDADGSCLLDRMPVRYSPSARALAPAGQDAPPAAARRLVAVADPTGTLTWAGPECAAVAAAAAAAGIAASVLSDADATAASVLQALAGATHVHVASHGRFDSDDPLRSELLLAGRPLTLGDLLNEERLGRAELVVASACQTGITDFSRLPDEALGLPAGFLQAGATAAVATLWPVADHSTALLMAAFYARLLGGPGGPADPAAALAGAQSWLRDSPAGTLREFAAANAPDLALELAFKEPGDRLYAHPYYWAPFTLVGR